MDCCRPDLRDLTDEEARELTRACERDPALRRYWLAVRAWDAALSDAFRNCDPPVPDGLQARLLAAASAAVSTPDQQTASASCTADPGQPASAASPAPAVTPRQSIRWTAAVAASLLATTALLAVATWLLWPRDTLTTAQVVDAARTWLAQLDAEAWRTSGPPIDAFPLDQAVRVEIAGWQPCTGLAGASSLAYQAAIPPDRTTAVLFVVRTRLGSQLPSLPPAVPDATTGNLCIGVWKAEGYLYVLVVPGRESNYRQALVTPTFA